MLEEMVVRILSRLPPKSLVRFRCASKLWYTIINDPSFVAKHLSISNHNKFGSDTCILVKHTLLKDRSVTDEKDLAAFKNNFDNNNIDLLLTLLHICNDDDGDGDNLTYIVEELELPFPLSATPPVLQIAGHCNGLICLENNVIDIVILCNPAIREFEVLPKSYILNNIPPRADDDDDYTAPWASTVAMGFGFDFKSKEYKVVRVVETTLGDNTELATRAEVYTMGTNSWKELENIDLGCHVFWTPSFAMHFKGIFYWWANAPVNKELILTFDMSDELFHQIPVPDCFDWTDKRYRSLAVLKESLVLLTYEVDEVPKLFDIWMMDESTGVKGSWTKYLVFGPVEGIKISLVFWKSEELLMVTNDRRVASYNLSSRRLHDFPIQGVEGAFYMQAFNYVNSIISVKESAT